MIAVDYDDTEILTLYSISSLFWLF